jgi:hypothetical protein
VVTTGGDGAARVWNAEDRERTRGPATGVEKIDNVAYSRDGRVIAATCADRTLHVRRTPEQVEQSLRSKAACTSRRMSSLRRTSGD